MSIHELRVLCEYKERGNVLEKAVIDHEKILHLELVNSNKDESLINANKHVYEFDEKRLHDLAAAEVMQTVERERLNAAGDQNQSKKKRKEMSNEEKSKQSRDRNREHARNTRLRKKVYVTKLKEFVENLSEQKRSEIKQCSDMGVRIHEMHTIRKERVRQFLNYRANNVQDRALWGSILADDQTFTLTQPYLMYRHFQHNPPCNIRSLARKNSNSSSSSVASSSSVGSASRVTAGKPTSSYTPLRKNSGVVVIRGIGGLMVDCASLRLLVEGVGEGTQSWTDALFRGHTCSMRYEVNQHGGMLASGDTVFCNFCMYTDGLRTPSVACDGFVVPGTLDCKFDTENKIVSVEMTLDVAAFIRQYEVMSSLCPSMLRHVLTSLDAIQVNTQTPHVVVCKVPLGAALVVYVNEAYWKSIGVDPTSSIAQMENWRGVSVMDFLTIMQHPYNLYKDKPVHPSVADSIRDQFDDQSFLYKPHVALPTLLHNQIVGSVENAFVQGRASSCSYCSLAPANKEKEMILNYVKFFPVMMNTENMGSNIQTTHSGNTVSHVLLLLKRYTLRGEDAVSAKSAVFLQYQQYQQEQIYHQQSSGLSLAPLTQPGQDSHLPTTGVFSMKGRSVPLTTKGQKAEPPRQQKKDKEKEKEKEKKKEQLQKKNHKKHIQQQHQPQRLQYGHTHTPNHGLYTLQHFLHHPAPQPYSSDSVNNPLHVHDLLNQAASSSDTIAAHLPQHQSTLSATHNAAAYPEQQQQPMNFSSFPSPERNSQLDLSESHMPYNWDLFEQHSGGESDFSVPMQEQQQHLPTETANTTTANDSQWPGGDIQRPGPGAMWSA